MRPQEKENQHRQFSTPGIKISDRHKASTWQALWLGQLKLLSITCVFHVHEAPMGPTSSVVTVTTDRRKAYFADTDALHPCRCVHPGLLPLHYPFKRQPGVQWSCSLKLLTAGLWDANHSCTRMRYLTSENYLS